MGAEDLGLESGWTKAPPKEGFVSRPYAGYGQPANVDHVPIPVLDPIELLPTRTRERVRRLEFDHQEAVAVSSALTGEIRFLHSRAADQRDNAAALAYSAKGDVGMLPRLEAAQRAAQAAETQLRAAQRRAAAAEERRNAIGGLLGNVRNFISDLGTITISEIEVSPPKKIPADLPAAIESLRRRLRELEADKRRAELAPWSQPESREEARRQVLALAAGGCPDLGPLIDGRGGKIRFPVTHGHGMGEPDGGLRFALWLLTDMVVEKLDKIIDEWALPGDALSSDQRRQKLEEIEGDMLSVQRDECALIELAAERGLQIAHRSDVNPQAYLGVQLEGLKI